MINKYYKTTLGLRNAQVLVAGDQAYTTAATYAAFVAGAPSATNGSIGVFNAETGALVPNTATTFTTDSIAGIASLSPTTEFFIATINSGVVSKSYNFRNGDIIRRRFIPYKGPVKQISYLGWDYATGNLNLSTVTPSQVFALQISENTPANEPVTRRAYQSVTSIAATQIETTYNTLSDTTAQINASGNYQAAFRDKDQSAVIADLTYGGNATIGAITGTGSATLTKGSTTITVTTHNVVAGDYLVFSNQVNQANAAFNQVFAAASTSNNILYKVVAVTTTTIVLDRPYTGENQVVAAANWGTGGTFFARITGANFAAGTNVLGVKFVARRYFTFFTIGSSQALISSTKTLATAYDAGEGIALDVQWAEQQGYVQRGVQTFNSRFKEDFGVPTFVANRNRAYGTIELQLRKDFRSVASPIQQDFHYTTILIYAPYRAASTNPAAAADAESFATINANKTAAFPTNINYVADDMVAIPAGSPTASVITDLTVILRPSVS